jgi:3-oxoacyl-[acyl-carrier-protein] synthase II
MVFEELEHALAQWGKNLWRSCRWRPFSRCQPHDLTTPRRAWRTFVHERAFEDAGLQFTTSNISIPTVLQHPQGDIAEPKAIVSLFGEHAYNISINSTKSMTGHLLGGAGVIEAIATLLAVKHDIVPPNN